MIENISLKDKSENSVTPVQSGLASLKEAQGLMEHHRVQGLAALNELFRDGTPPASPLDGRYAGKLVALDIAPGLTALFQSITEAWMPWLGKTFNSSRQVGDNIFSRDSYPLARFFNPFYKGFLPDGAETYRGFSFRTHIESGLADPDRSVLKIDYNLDGNPLPTIRRILDELVQIDNNLYLGKAHVHWWSGGWQTVAFFTLVR